MSQIKGCSSSRKGCGPDPPVIIYYAKVWICAWPTTKSITNMGWPQCAFQYLHQLRKQKKGLCKLVWARDVSLNGDSTAEFILKQGNRGKG